MLQESVIEKLKKIDTPTITNVIATYQSSLRLYDAWFGEWYTDTTIKCMYPEYGPTVGHVATVVYALKNPYAPGLRDQWVLPEHLEETKKPIILCAKQDFPPELKNRVGLFGGMMANRFSAQGVVGIVSDGPMRDFEEIRNETDVQMLVTGLTPGHGDFVVKEVGVPITIGGMTVMPGDMVHMDLHGACKFPEKYAEEILKRAEEALAEETEEKAFFQGPDFSLKTWKTRVGE
jgi:4-hydroxy-4-methyl-2-oxoglutarate aldolase